MKQAASSAPHLNPTNGAPAKPKEAGERRIRKISQCIAFDGNMAINNILRREAPHSRLTAIFNIRRLFYQANQQLNIALESGEHVSINELDLQKDFGPCQLKNFLELAA